MAKNKKETKFIGTTPVTKPSQEVKKETAEISLVRSEKTKGKNFKAQDKMPVSEIFMYAYVGIVAVFLIVCILNTFNITKIKPVVGETTDYILTYFGIMLSMFIYIILSSLEKYKKLYISESAKIIMYSFVLIFFCFYPFFNLFTLLATDILFNIVLGALLAVFGLSIFYNSLKNDKNQVRANPFVVLVFAVCFAVFSAVMVEIISYLIDVIFGTNLQLASVTSRNDTMIDLITVTLSSMVMSTMLYLSLKGDKKIANALLIKTN